MAVADLNLLTVSRLLYVGHGTDAGHSSPLREGIAMKKISMSRFQIHDELTAPEGSVPVLRGALATGGQLPNFLGVLAGAPAALRGYARFRSELRHGTLSHQTLERIAIAVAEHYHSEPGIALHARTARQAGIGLDELALAREWDSRDEREATLLRYLKALVEGAGKPPMHLHEEAREAGWSDEQILEAVAVVALEGFTALVNVAGDVPVDGSTEDARTLKAA
jgi:alkylhydroperoxidase family enzyme